LPDKRRAGRDPEQNQPIEIMSQEPRIQLKGIRRLELTFENELVDRIGWFIRMRWMAGLGVSGTILVSTSLFDLLVNRDRLLLISSSIFLVNIVYLLYFKWLQSRRTLPGWHTLVSRLANVQISIDLLLLNILVYFSGGVENPFSFYFIFHIIIASILLSTTASYLQAALAVGVYDLILLAEYLRLIPHHRLFRFFSPEIYDNPVFLLGNAAVFSTTLFISVYMATSITRQLRSREEELVRVKNSLEQANEQLQKLHEYRTRFILRVEHELKAPLAAIHSLITVILTSFEAGLEPRVKELLRRSEARVMNLLDMIRELLELSRMKMAAHRFNMQNIEPGALIEHQIELVRHQAAARALSLSAEIQPGLPSLYADPEAFNQILLNLLSNAVKYTERGGVKLKAAVEDELFVLSVSDTGIGLSEDEKGRLFEEFFRGSRAKGLGEGTGLGLSIIKEIVEAHGGAIEVESQAGKGSTFTVRLPLKGE